MAKRWTPEEAEYLHDNIGIKSYQQISEYLGRSVSAIKVYRIKNKLPHIFQGNYYTYTTLGEELGISKSAVQRHYFSGRLKGAKAQWRARYGNHPTLFIEEDIVKFLAQYYFIFIPAKVPNLYFKNIIKQNLIKDMQDNPVLNEKHMAINDLARMLGIYKSVMRDFVYDGKLHQIDTGKIFKGKPHYYILESELLRFLKENYILFNPDKITNQIFKNVIRDCYEKKHGQQNRTPQVSTGTLGFSCPDN